MSPVDACFLQVLVGQKGTRRNHELQNSTARSHAARVSHRLKRRNESSKVQQEYSSAREDVKPSTSHNAKALDMCDDEIPTTSLAGRTMSNEMPLKATNIVPYNSRMSTGWQWSNGFRVDPFSCFPTMYSRNSVIALDYCWFSLACFGSTLLTDLVIWCGQTRLAIHETPFGRLRKYGKWMLEPLSMKPDLFFALMAGMLAQLTGPDTPSYPLTGLMHGAAELRAQAMRFLQLRLMGVQGSDDDGVVLSILFMALAEGILDQLPAFWIHRSELARFVRYRGSINNLNVDNDIKGMIWRFQSWSNESSTEQNPGAYPLRPLSFSVYVQLSQLPPGFSALALAHSLPWSLIQVISHIQQLELPQALLPKQTLEAEDGTQPKAQTYGNFFDACPALGLSEEVFLRHKNVENAKFLVSGSSLQIMLRLALVRYHSVFSNFSGQRREKRYRFITVKLSQYLKECSFSVRDAENSTNSTSFMNTRKAHFATGWRQDKGSSSERLAWECFLWIWLVAICTCCSCLEEPFSGTFNKQGLCEGMQEALKLQDLLHAHEIYTGIGSWSMEDFEQFGDRFFLNSAFSNRLKKIREYWRPPQHQMKSR